ncbi:ankyrin repeat protein [Aspergillus stella-maris]|uniref:ankyrin repeat protein n=1 Tax=Aspergillus stella-maris TaxID=1810926 RepID=UPI003CCE383B
MDPVTALGLLASISTLLKASKGALDLIQSFKDAERDFADLATNLERFHESLEGFNRVFRSRQAKHSISEAVLRKVIDEGKENMAEVEKRLNQIHKSESSTLRRARFLQYRSRLDALKTRIHTLSAQLHGFITLVHAETFLAACNQNPQLLEACAEAVEETDSNFLLPEAEIPQPAGTLTKSRSHTSLSSGGTSVATDTGSARTGSISSSTSSEMMLKQVNKQGRRSSISRALDLDRGRLVVRRSCRHDCFCRCHDQPGTPDAKKGFSKFGARIFHESNVPNVECSDPSCAGAQQKTSISASSFKRAMSQLMSSNTVKIHYRMNTYRTVPEGSNAMRYIKQGNLEKLKAAVQSGEATPWDTAPDGWSLLHTAAYARQLETVQYLVALGAETETADFAARKPVDLAFLKSVGVDGTQVEKDIVQIFSKEDDCTADYDFTPIHIAVLELYDPTDNERPTLEQLIDFVDTANNAPADTDWARWKSKYQRRSPLYLAIIEQFRASAAENPNTSKVIHNLTDQKDRMFHWTPLHWASATGQRAKMKTLVENGADPFIQSNLNFTIIHSAVESNARETLSYALEIARRYPDQLRIDHVNVWGETALMMAAQGCRVECVQLLLDTGADRNIRQENQQVALHYAGLSDRGNLRRETVALICGDVTTSTSVAKLEIDAQDEDGKPPIFDFLDDVECLMIFVRHGARLDLSDNEGNTILHHACIQGQTKSLKALLPLLEKCKNIIDQANEAGNTALFEALRHENIKCALILLKNEDIRVGDTFCPDGWAPVHYAAKLGNISLLKAILTHSSFVRGMRTRDGKTARVVAMEAGSWAGEVKELLNAHNSVI